MADSLGRGRSLAAPQFPGDDGAADPHLRARLVEVSDGHGDPVAFVRGLRDKRLLTSVVAVLDSVGENGEEKDSHMAVVSMVNAGGERGLLAFTGVDSLTAWNPDARPVPALGRDIARAAIDDGAAAVVLDVAGPRMAAISGRMLTALADEVDLDALSARIHALLDPLVGPGAVAHVLDARTLEPGALSVPVPQADVVVVLRGIDGAQASALLDADDALYDLVPGGLALLPLD